MLETLGRRVLLALAMTVLSVGWLFLVAGVYHFGLARFPSGEENESGLQAIWEFAFSFWATSIATLIGAKAEFLGNTKVRRLFLVTLVGASVLFLGYSVIGGVLPLLWASL